MRKLLTIASALLITGNLIAGGLVTNTNQSAAWVRMPARNASTSIDAAYYNPAGLTKLGNGFHLSLSNQSIFQTREIVNDYAGPMDMYGLNENVYKGSAKALAFPSVSAVYKKDNIALSFGFYPVGGGGSAVYEKGLPSFEMSPSDLVPSLASQGATAYRLDAYFEGSSVFLGFQGGISYNVNEWLSIGAGVRYVTATNTYMGHLRDIEVNMGGTWTRADAIMTGIAGNATSAATNTTALVGGGAGALTLAAAEGAGIINATQRAQLEGALTAFGSPTTVTISQADVVFKNAAAQYTATATLLGDQEADVEQNGAALSPIFSVNLSPSEKLNIGIKYEMKTKLEVMNKTTKDLLTGYNGTIPITMFPDGAYTRNDMPSMLTVGIDYKVTDALTVALGGNYYFDKNADYGHKVDNDLKGNTPPIHIFNEDIIENNGFSLQAGIEYKITDQFLVSGGYSWANKGVNDKYQSDLTYGLATQTFGFGVGYNVNEKVQINLGGNTTIYMEDTKVVNHMVGTTNVKSNETYKKNTLLFGLGVDWSF
jgi:long-subunit fatty acid transport protein